MYSGNFFFLNYENKISSKVYESILPDCFILDSSQDIEDQPAPIEDEPSLSEEEMFKYSLQLVRDKYITEPEGKDEWKD